MAHRITRSNLRPLSLVIVFLVCLGITSVARATTPHVNVVCYGESTTQGYPYGSSNDYPNPSYPYPAQMQSFLDSNYTDRTYTVTNRGVDGAKAAELYGDLTGNTTHFLTSLNPDIAVIMIGGNDLLEDAGSSNQSQTVGEIQQCVDFIRSHTNPTGLAPKVLISAIPPNTIPLGNGPVISYNSLLSSSLINIDGYFSDNFTDLYNSSTGLGYSHLFYDLVHPNSDGYALIAENVGDEVGVMVIPEPTTLCILAGAFCLFFRIHRPKMVAMRV